MSSSSDAPSVGRHPRHWPTRFGLALLRCWVLLPVGVALGIGRLAGRALFYLPTERRHIVEVNLRLCFPDLASEERRALAREHFEALGMSVVETGLAWWAEDARLASLYEVEGLEHLAEAQARGRGVLLFSCHVGCQELGVRLLHRHQDFDVIYKPFKNPVLRAVSDASRGQHGNLVPRHALKPVLRAVRAGGVAWFAPDQSEGQPGGVLAEFMGEPKIMTSGAWRLPQITGAAVVPFFIYRENPTRYRLVLLPALEGFPSEDAKTNATVIGQLIEQQVRLAPEQYSWAHRRFRKRLGVLPSPY